jgi:hypothetical protein
MQKITITLAFASALLIGSAARADASDASTATERRAAAVDAPDAERQAADDTASYGQRTFAPRDAVDAPARPGAPAQGRSSAESELDALTAAATAEPPAFAAASHDDAGVVSGAEAELHALLAWQEAGDRRAALRTTAVSQQAAAASQEVAALPDAHDDAGVDPSGAVAPGTGSSRAPARDPHTAASDDCDCS